MSEARLYRYSEFTRTKRPDKGVDSQVVDHNASLRSVSGAALPYWQNHVNLSRDAIITSAMKAAPGRAIVFGAGNCSDIPLEDLAVRFNSVTLVDAEPSGVTRAVEALPAELQPKINLEIEDLTGFLDMQPFSLLLSRAKSPDDFAQTALVSLSQMQPKSPRFSDGYDFVCSNLLVSQLATFVHEGIGSMLNSKFPGNDFDQAFLQIQALRQGREQVVTDFNNAFVLDHFQLLRASAKQPGGVIHLADTFSLSLYTTSLDGGIIFLDQLRRPVPQRIETALFMIDRPSAEALTAGASFVDGQAWDWVKKPPEAAADIGLVFTVKSLTLVTT